MTNNSPIKRDFTLDFKKIINCELGPFERLNVKISPFKLKIFLLSRDLSQLCIHPAFSTF
jgi:hypothetical protein